MKLLLFLWVCALALVCVGSSQAAPYDLDAGVYIMDGASPLDVNFYSIPCVTDWNNDGKKDLLVGEYINGKLRLYLNIGSNIHPQFLGSTYVQSGGMDISVLPYF